MSHRDPFDRGLAYDLRLLAKTPDRRRVLGWIVTAVAAPLAACVGDDGDDSNGGDTSTDPFACEPGEALPSETAGPYPGDGSNGPNALTVGDVVRKDIRSSLEGGTGTADGVALTLRLQIVRTSDCTPLAGYAVYVWHCDREGGYSLYTVPDASYLRGVQVTDDEGFVEFTSIFPGCYPGRWPHIHIEVYASVEATTNSDNAVITSQLALPEAACVEVYQEVGYEASVESLDGISLDSDLAFFEGWELQLATTTGDVASGFVAELLLQVEG